MDVRCPRCHRAASEWAARCPDCGEDLTLAEVIAERPSPETVPVPFTPGSTRPGRSRAGLSSVAPDPVAAGRPGIEPGRPADLGDRPADRGLHRRRPMRRTVRTGLAIAAAVVVVVAVVIGTSPRPDRRARTAPSATSVPPAIASVAPRGPGVPSRSSVVGNAAERLQGQRLFVADGGATEAVLADGTVLQRLGRSTGAPAQPVAVGNDTVVYQDGGEVYAFDVATGADPIRLGSGQQVLLAGPGRVDLVSASGGGHRVTPVRIGAGAVSPSGGYTVAGPDIIVAVTLEGLLVEAPDGDLALRDPSNGTTTAVTAMITNVVAVSGHEVAWTSETGCSLFVGRAAYCPLHLTDLQTRVDRVVHLRGTLGFTGTGTFSPDGRYLAVYDRSGGRQPGSRLDLALLRTSSGPARVVGSVSTDGRAAPTVTWSETGEWLFFGGSGSFDAVDVVPPDPSIAPDQPVPLPLSINCCVVGF